RRFAKQSDRLTALERSRHISKPSRVSKLNRSQAAFDYRHGFQQTKSGLFSKRIFTGELHIDFELARRSAGLQTKCKRRPRGLRRSRRDSYERKKLSLVNLGNSIQFVDIHLGEPRKQLHQRDAGIVDIMIGPVRSVERNDRS